MVAIGIGYEYLTETVARHKLHNLLHTMRVEFVEYVVEQQEWCGLGCCAPQEVELGEFQGENKRLVLSLRPLAPNLIAAKQHFEIVAMNSMQRVAYSTVLHPVALYDIEQSASLGVRHIAQRHNLMPIAHMIINLLKHGHHLLHKHLSCVIYALAVARHLLFPYFHECHVGLVVHLQQGVSLLQSLVVAIERLNISIIILRYDYIHEPTSLLAATRDEQLVGRRHKNQRYKTNMLRESFIFLFVALEVLFSAALHATVDVDVVASLVFIHSVDDKEFLVVGYHL